MEYIEIFLSLCGTIAGLTLANGTFLAKFIKNAKAKKAAEQLVKISGALIPYIEQAEGFLNYSGAEKKEFVMTKASRFALENKIKFEPELLSEKVEELVQLSKIVNGREKSDSANDGTKNYWNTAEAIQTFNTQN